MSYSTSHRCVIWLRRLAAGVFSVLVIAAFSSLSIAAELQAGASSAELAKVEQILRQAGATPSELAKFEKEMQYASSADIAEVAEYLRRQSPAELAEFLKQLQPSPDDQY